MQLALIAVVFLTLIAVGDRDQGEEDDCDQRQLHGADYEVSESQSRRV